MKNYRYLSFEIGKFCNLSKDHPWCPSGNPERNALIADDPPRDSQIIDAINCAYCNLGFTGFVAFHYYNEPTLFMGRIAGIINSFVNSPAKFSLWTNGTTIKSGHEKWLSLFDEIVITNYHDRDFEWFMDMKNVKVQKPNPDKRLNLLDAPLNRKCNRVNYEVPFDFCGNMHLCCIDWRNKVKIGNLKHDNFCHLMHLREETIEKINNSSGEMSEFAPEICKKCVNRG